MVFHAKPSEHLAKLRRVAYRLDRQEMHADDMDDFCKTAWHLIELVEKFADSSREERRRATKLRSDPDLRLCRYAANVAKHAASRGDKDRVALAGVEIRRGYGVGRYGKGGFGVGEQSVSFVFEDGTERDAFDFVAAVLTKWEAVFVDTKDKETTKPAI